MLLDPAELLEHALAEGVELFLWELVGGDRDDGAAGLPGVVQERALFIDEHVPRGWPNGCVGEDFAWDGIGGNGKWE